MFLFWQNLGVDLILLVEENFSWNWLNFEHFSWINQTDEKNLFYFWFEQNFGSIYFCNYSTFHNEKYFHHIWFMRSLSIEATKICNHRKTLYDLPEYLAPNLNRNHSKNGLITSNSKRGIFTFLSFFQLKIFLWKKKLFLDWWKCIKKRQNKLFWNYFWLRKKYFMNWKMKSFFHIWKTSLTFLETCCSSLYYSRYVLIEVVLM